jgi:hypothetical protein
MKNQLSPKQVMMRYLQQFFFAIFMYIVILSASVILLRNFEFARVWQIIIAILPALPIIFMLITLLRLLSYSDELHQRINLLAISFSAVLTGLITFSYSFLENIGAPKLPTVAVLPMLFVFWGMGLGYFTRKYE